MGKPKITFLMCDDEAEYLDDHQIIIASVMEMDMNIDDPSLYEFVTFPDGIDAYRWVTDRENARGVILITDGNMRHMEGFDLIQALHLISFDHLPSAIAMCTSYDQAEFDEKMKKKKIDELAVTLISKRHVSKGLVEFIPHAVTTVAREIGLCLPPLEFFRHKEDKKSQP